ncbi:MAG: DUF4124 domain-containing protein [Pseudomonadota bacterium]
MHFFPFLIMTLILSVGLSAPLQAGRLYKWVDDEGRIHYSDRLPPADSTRPHSQLDERGITVDSVGAAKTAEQIRQEAEVERLRQERQRLIDEQRMADRVLLRTFRTEDDIIMTRNGQLQAVDSYIKITQSNIKRLKLRLEQMQRDAAARELSGKRISKKFQADIEAKNLALKEAYESIVNREHDKDRIRKSFAQDLNRFRELKHLEESNDPMQEAAESFVKALKNVYICPDDSCNEPWKRAKAYMRQYNTTPIKMDADNVLMSGTAVQDDDISITLSRIRDSKREQTLIFLDLQCEDSPQGLDYCASDKLESIRQGFQAAVAQSAVD